MNQSTDAALLVIDVQKGLDDPGQGARNNPDAEKRIADLLAAWRAAGKPVIVCLTKMSEAAAARSVESRITFALGLAERRTSAAMGAMIPRSPVFARRSSARRDEAALFPVGYSSRYASIAS